MRSSLPARIHASHKSTAPIARPPSHDGSSHLSKLPVPGMWQEVMINRIIIALPLSNCPALAADQEGNQGPILRRPKTGAVGDVLITNVLIVENHVRETMDHVWLGMVEIDMGWLRLTSPRWEGRLYLHQRIDYPWPIHDKCIEW